jgi:DNA polymerase I-like protein with 3'-5' exonuclease and polymerase domains
MAEKAQSFLPLYEETPWKPPEVFPVLDDRYKRVGIDCESTGTDVHGKDVPVGTSLYLEDGRNYYFPWGHEGGGNLDKGRVVNFLQRELKGKTLIMAEAKFDTNMHRKIGVDFEAIGCKLREVQFQAALLDGDERRSFKLDDMAEDYLNEKKVVLPHKNIWQLPASIAGPYAEVDARLTFQLDEVLQPRIVAQDLATVLDVENELIYCVAEMERNGTPLDVEKLVAWLKEVDAEYSAIILDLYAKYGRRVNPNAAKDLEQLFKQLGIEYGFTEKSGMGSFTDGFLKSVDHPAAAAVRKARTLDSLKSKYLKKYDNERDGNVIRYKLHQLKGDDYGTVSGRFSSSSINIQQVFDPERQADKLGESRYTIRELFIPEPGKVWVKADASQIEFRLFAHYSQSKKLIQAYNDNPNVDFHSVVADVMRVKRKPAKGLNFGKLYGMGRDKMSRQTGLDREESDVLFDKYDELFPEAKVLMNRAMELAKTRGYVKTLLGRRARFATAARLHSALNRVIQGSAADVLKKKLIEVYNYRKELGLTMRMTVHDEVDGDLEDPGKAVTLKELLDAPILDIRVPLTWDVQVGPNWAHGTKV